jgi:hypothetical protein
MEQQFIHCQSLSLMNCFFCCKLNYKFSFHYETWVHFLDLNVLSQCFNQHPLKINVICIKLN